MKKHPYHALIKLQNIIGDLATGCSLSLEVGDGEVGIENGRMEKCTMEERQSPFEVNKSKTVQDFLCQMNFQTKVILVPTDTKVDAISPRQGKPSPCLALEYSYFRTLIF